MYNSICINLLPKGRTQMKFAMSFSCGKDSTLALHKEIAAGNEPVCLIVMVNSGAGRSFFHGADEDMLTKYSLALGIPMIKAYTDGSDYHIKMEETLIKAKGLGAEAACFGDIDIEGNKAWSETRCKAAGLKSLFPLWQRSRRENVEEIIDLGYKCIIKSINSRLLPKSLLGRTIDRDTVKIMEGCGIDVCGENGEYHTLSADGPIFKSPMDFHLGEILDSGDYSVIDIR